MFDELAGVSGAVPEALLNIKLTAVMKNKPNNNEFRLGEAEEQFRKRYIRCRTLMEGNARFSGMSDEEKDAYAQRLATPEYLDLTCDWAFKHLFHNHPDLLVMLLNDILQDNIDSVEFRGTELADAMPQDKRVVFDLLCRTPDGRSFLVEMQKASRSDQRDRLFYYGARIAAGMVKPGDGKYTLSPIKVICIMNYEERHPDSPDDKILYQYRTAEVETGEPFGDQISFYLLELPRVMRYTDEYDSPVAAWCRIFRNFSIFVRSRAESDARLRSLESAMRLNGLDDAQIDNYFSDMMTKEEMLPYIEGAEQQGYLRGKEEMLPYIEGAEQQGYYRGLEEGEIEGMAEGVAQVAKALLAMGQTKETVAKATGLTAAQIDELMHEGTRDDS